MGQTGNIGRLSSLYRIKIDNRKLLYLRIFFHCADLAGFNSWLLYGRDPHEFAPNQRTMDLWYFKGKIASASCMHKNSGKKKIKWYVTDSQMSNMVIA